MKSFCTANRVISVALLFCHAVCFIISFFYSDDLISESFLILPLRTNACNPRASALSVIALCEIFHTEVSGQVLTFF